MKETKEDAYKNILAIIEKYRSSIEGRHETLVSHCSRLEALEYLLPQLQQLVTAWDTQPLETSQEKLVQILAQVRDRTKRTSLSLFENAALAENQFIIDLANWLENLENKPAIALLCPDLSLDSAHDKYQDLPQIPLEELFGTFVESSHDGYVIPVKILTEMDLLGTEQVAAPANYYYDYMKEPPAGADTTKLTQSDLKKLFQHSPEAEKIAQLQQEYWILQQQDPSLYANLNLFVKRLKKESVNERGSEYDTGAGAYQLIIDFFQYYDALPPEEKERVPAQVKEQLRLIYAYSSDPKMNVNALGEQEVQTCTATRSKELEKAIQSSENSIILKTIAISSQTRAEQLKAIETEVAALQKTIADKSYRGKPSPGQLASLVSREQWGFSDLFPEDSYVESIHFLSCEDIRALFSQPDGLFATDIRHQVKDFFYNEKMIDVVLSLNSSQKIELCSSLKDLIVPGLKNYQKLSYLIQLIGGDNLEKAIGPELERVILDAKNALIQQYKSSRREDPFLGRYLQLSKMLMQSNMSADLKKRLEFSDDFIKTCLQSNKQNFATTLVEMIALPLSSETIKSVVLYASAQPEFYRQLDSFHDMVDLFAKTQLDTATKKSILQNFFSQTPPKNRNFYLGLPEKTYDIILTEPELMALIPVSILDALPYNPYFQDWLKKDSALDYPMSRSLNSSLQASFKINRTFAKADVEKMLKHAQPEKWPKKRPRLDELNLKDSVELCQLVREPNIAQYIFSGKRSATFLKDALELDKTTYSQPFRRLLMTSHGAVMLTHLNSFIKVRMVLSSIDPVLSQTLFKNLAANHSEFLKNIARNEDDEKTVLTWLKQTSLLYRLGLGFLEPLIGYLSGPTQVQSWERHMVAQAAARLSAHSREESQPQTAQKENTQDNNLGPSSQSALCFSSKRAPVTESLKNKK